MIKKAYKRLKDTEFLWGMSYFYLIKLIMIITITFYIILTVGIRIYFFAHAIYTLQPFQYIPTSGRSMTPTILSGDTIFINTLDTTPKRGDCITFYISLPEYHHNVTKRVIGLPGDTLEFIKADANSAPFLYINGVYYEEDYVVYPDFSQEEETYVVPEDCYFVMGDNRPESDDSRGAIGFVEAERILGVNYFKKNKDSWWPIKFLN